MVFAMGLDDDTRIVISRAPEVYSSRLRPRDEGGSSPGIAPLHEPEIAVRNMEKGKGRHGQGTVTCTQTFTTGLVVTTVSDGTVSCLR